MAQFMLLLHENPNEFAGLTQKQMESVIAEYFPCELLLDDLRKGFSFAARIKAQRALPVRPREGNGRLRRLQALTRTHDCRSADTGPSRLSRSPAPQNTNCANDREAEYSMDCGPPPRPYGSSWWNSSPRRSVQRRPCPFTKVHRPQSRFRTTRLTAAGMYRDDADVSVSSRVFRGALVSANRLASSLSSFSVTAASMTAARSSCTSAWRRSSLSRSSALAVKVTWYRAGESGWTTPAGGGAGGANGAGCASTGGVAPTDSVLSRTVTPMPTAGLCRSSGRLPLFSS